MSDEKRGKLALHDQHEEIASATAGPVHGECGIGYRITAQGKTKSEALNALDQLVNGVLGGFDRDE